MRQVERGGQQISNSAIPACAGIAMMLLCFFCYPAHAARFTGNYLMEMCSSDGNGRELVAGGHVACQSYIAGILDYQNVMRSLGVAPSIDFCVPENVNMNQLQNDVARYLYANKNEHGSFVASPAVAMALFTDYPCRRGQ